ncbi:MAG: mannose-6-phosphate isomerase, class I, partial [Gammaproteobacteria bacterium]|nr:mannose-6-phosphate isomerase, class I [Gammaproteobacteria bacterium]
MNIFQLLNEVQHYAWGSKEAIPALLRVANHAAEPWAELWMGAHPRAPSRITVADRTDGLDAVVQTDPPRWLGEAVATRFAGEFPFLLKLLAAATPLSIQVHPDEDQARAGFDREEAQGVPRSAADREYPDPHPKPELVVALEPFTALKGFRNPADIAANFREFGLDGAAGLAEGLAALTTGEPGAGLQRFVESWLTLTGQQRTQALERLGKSASRREDELGAVVRQLLSLYPGDNGVFGPLVLNLVHLAPGEGLFLGAREPHAYLSGFAIELCAASDNVLRGGLTPKHVDVPELLRILRFESQAPHKLCPQPGEDGLAVYPTPTRFFRLARTTVDVNHTLQRTRRAGVEIVLCTAGNV